MTHIEMAERRISRLDCSRLCYHANTPDQSCDHCASQENGHYCLLHSRPMKNMNIQRCADWTPKKARRETPC